MDDFRAKKEKLISIKRTIERMPNNIERMRLINGHTYLLKYLCKTREIKENEMLKYTLDNDFYKDYFNKVANETSNQFIRVYDSSSNLCSKMQGVVDVYKDNDFCSFECTHFYGVNKDKMYKYLNEFFKYIGNDVLNLYNKMCDDNNIAITPCYRYANGESINTIQVDNPSIIINDFEKYFYYYTTFAHEIGHSYQAYLQRNQNCFERFNPFIETTSLLFESMFIEFLKTKNFDKKIIADYEIDSHTYFLNNVSIALLLIELISMGELHGIDFRTLKYQVNNYSYEDLTNMIESNCGSIKLNRKDLPLSSIQYALGNGISMYFLNKMKNDFEGTWKEYKDFITMSNYTSLDEILDKYYNVNVIKENINGFIKSYRNR